MTMYDLHHPMPPWPWLVASAAKPAPRYAKAALRPVAAMRRERILAALRKLPWGTGRTIGRELHLDTATVRGHLRALVRAGVAEAVGGGRFAVAGGAT